MTGTQEKALETGEMKTRKSIIVAIKECNYMNLDTYKHRMMAWVLVLGLVLAYLPSTVFAAAGDTADNPIIISSVGDLQALATAVNENGGATTADKYYQLEPPVLPRCSPATPIPTPLPP